MIEGFKNTRCEDIRATFNPEDIIIRKVKRGLSLPLDFQIGGVVNSHKFAKAKRGLPTVIKCEPGQGPPEDRLMEENCTKKVGKWLCDVTVEGERFNVTPPNGIKNGETFEFFLEKEKEGAPSERIHIAETMNKIEVVIRGDKLPDGLLNLLGRWAHIGPGGDLVIGAVVPHDKMFKTSKEEILESINHIFDFEDAVETFVWTYQFLTIRGYRTNKLVKIQDISQNPEKFTLKDNGLSLIHI